ncbi:AIG2 family protein [Methanohalobium evestigatum Z-7303]|uniref:AIG2 family protein n=1 Tax=Methanohalobium evestigatum (strain ATCC BAA-1072 / DSM 3721 / NBRC 107634 / OCM 161 / Z-7303) TaxID=644295 RepID=D7EAT3_METEZ|nr:gamma-glutamylcyclotransferase family protein [Methanohalobium evestigatum]ADI74450.1 AIG2 family protein [Methanohalobium evestigatum Z-7303]
MYVFVYGTLKSGCVNSNLLNDADFISSASTIDKYTMLDFGIFPGVVEGNTSKIYGEVYDVDFNTLVSIDEFEGVWFCRDEVRLDNNIIAYMYFLVQIPDAFDNKYEIVESGNWQC